MYKRGLRHSDGFVVVAENATATLAARSAACKTVAAARSAKGFADMRLNPETSKAWESFPLSFAMFRSNWVVSAEILILISFLAIMCT